MKQLDEETGRDDNSVVMGVRFAPANDSGQPAGANYIALNVAPGMAFSDFGFPEPAMLAPLRRLAKREGKHPGRLNGRLTMGVAMEYDGLARLHRWTGEGALEGIARAALKIHRSAGMESIGTLGTVLTSEGYFGDGACRAHTG